MLDTTDVEKLKLLHSYCNPWADLGFYDSFMLGYLASYEGQPQAVMDKITPFGAAYHAGWLACKEIHNQKVT